MPIWPRGRDAGADQILGDGVEIVEAALPVLAQRRLVPGRAIFAAAADIGEHIGIAGLDPEQAERAGAIGLAGEIGRRLGGAEAAIGVDQRRHRPASCRAAGPGNRGPACRRVERGEALLDGDAGGVELRRQALDQADARPAAVTAWSEGGVSIAFDGDEGEIGGRSAADMEGAVGGKIDRRAGPARRRRCGATANSRPETSSSALTQSTPSDGRDLLDRLARASAPSPARARPARPAAMSASEIEATSEPIGQGPAARFERPVQPDDQPAVEHVLRCSPSSGIGSGRRPPLGVTSEIRLVQKVRPRLTKFQRRSPSVTREGIEADVGAVRLRDRPRVRRAACRAARSWRFGRSPRWSAIRGRNR